MNTVGFRSSSANDLRIAAEVGRVEAFRNPPVGNLGFREASIHPTGQHDPSDPEIKTMAVKRVPDGYHRVTPHLTVKDAAQMIEFYKKAFGAVEKGRAPGPDGKSI